MASVKRVLSLGAGVQSSVVLLMSARGELPPLDAAVFADTGWEPQAVYDHLDWLEEEVSPLSIVRARADEGRSLKQDTIDNVNNRGRSGYAMIPFYTRPPSGGALSMAHRQCTKFYKIAPIRRAVRQLFPKGPIEQWLGISWDESHRMRDSDRKYITHRYPLVDLRLTRRDCQRWFNERYAERTLPRSACLGCPLKSSADWLQLAQGPASEYEETIAIDESLREDGWSADGWTYYLHKRGALRPELERLQRIADEGEQSDMFDINSFGDECAGVCGV